MDMAGASSSKVVKAGIVPVWRACGDGIGCLHWRLSTREILMQTPQRNAVGWFELYVADMARAKAFYQAVFQRDMVDLPAQGEDMAMCAFQWLDNAPGAAGALVKSPHMQPGGGGGTLVYFSCVDCAVEAGRVAQSGGQVLQPKFAIGEYGFIAMARDTEGNVIGLHSVQ